MCLSQYACLVKQGLKIKTPYITWFLAFLVLTVLVNVRMRAQDIDHVWAPKLTGKVKWCFKALEHTDKHTIWTQHIHYFLKESNLIWLLAGMVTYSLIWSVEVKIYNVADTFLQHNFLVIRVHEAHELWVFQSVQQQLGNSCLVLLGCHMHHVVPAALLTRQNSETTV